MDVTGVVLTKLDGDTRGGAALSIRAVTGKPIKFCGIGEKMNDIEVFYPDRMASRILGMGDVLTLIEKAQSAFSEEEALEMQKKMRTKLLYARRLSRSNGEDEEHGRYVADDIHDSRDLARQTRR